MIIEYLTQDEPLTLTEVQAHCRVDDTENAYLSVVVIPAARALAEAKTGCAIRPARYRDTFDGSTECVLSVGGVMAVEAVEIEGSAVDYTASTKAGRTTVSVPADAGKTCTVTYTAGSDIEQHPGARAWMLLVCGWLYAQRELLGGNNSEPPPHIAQSLLASLNVNPGF